MLSDGTNNWSIVDWAAVKAFSTTRTITVQAGIRVGTAEDITYA